MPATSACAGMMNAIVTSSMMKKSSPQNAPVPRKIAALRLLWSISLSSILASWISCWTSRTVSSTASRARSIKPRAPFRFVAVRADSVAEARGAEFIRRPPSFVPSFRAV